VMYEALIGRGLAWILLAITTAAVCPHPNGISHSPIETFCASMGDRYLEVHQSGVEVPAQR
jgi:hypothetical protein